MRVDEAATERFEHDGEQVPDTDAAEGEPTEAGGPATLFLEDDGVGDEGEVEGAVDDCYIDVPEDAVRFKLALAHLVPLDLVLSSILSCIVQVVSACPVPIFYKE